MKSELNGKTHHLVNGIHLFVLFGFSISQPLFDLLARHAGFFAAHQATPTEILIIILTLSIILPAVAWVLELVAGLISFRLEWRLHLSLVGILGAIFIFPVLKHIPYLAGGSIILLAVFPGIAFALVYAAYRPLRSFMTVLSLAPIIFVGSFAFTRPMYNLLFSEPVPQVLPTKVKIEAPIVMVVFDELSLISLFDEHREIDAARYPAFAALAKESTWFRNTTTVHELTQLALPAILTGRYPTDGSLLPTAGDFPLNLFTLLRGVGPLNVHESATALYLEAENIARPGMSDLFSRMGVFYSDILILYLHVILPDDLTEHLPPLEETWKDFARTRRADFKELASVKAQGREKQFYDFLMSITPCEGACLHYLHILLPHQPWEYLPSGKIYYPSTVFGESNRRWVAEEWWVVQAQQRHLLQVGFVDKLLGELLSHLKSIGLYDRSLIVIASDHGRSFWPKGKNRRLEDAEYPEDILGVPFLVKAPRQREGVVSDRNVETIDIVPTIADLLGIQIPWPVDGCSAVSEACPERNEKIAFTGREGPTKKMRFQGDILLNRNDSLERKIEIFGSGKKSNGLFMIGPYRHLVGRGLMDFDVGEAVGVRISPVPLPEGAKEAGFIPARILAFFHSEGSLEETPYVAIAVNDTIQAIAPALPDKDGKLLVSAMLPEDAFIGQNTDFQFFVIKGTTENPEIYRISIK